MPTLKIGDKSVNVDDSFLKLSPEEQSGTVDEIASSLGLSAPQEKPQRGVIDKLFGLTGPRFQTFPERAVRDILSLPQRTMEAAASAPPGTREFTEAVSGPAMETAGTFGPIGPAARGVATAVKAIRPEAPLQETIRDVISQQYGELDKLGIQIPQKDVAELAQQIRHDLMHGENAGHRPRNQPGTFDALDELEQAPGRFTDIDSIRKVLNNVRKDIAKNKSDSQAAGIAIGKIDDFLSTRAGDTGALAKSARGNVSALKKSEQITAGRESAELSAATTGSGANFANRYRQNIKWIIDPKYPWRRQGFRQEEIELMEEIARGGGRYSVENIARLVSKLGPDHPLSGWGTAIASFLSGDAGIGVATLAIGKIAQWLSEKMPLRKINRLDEMIRQRSSLGQQQQPLRITIPRPPISQVERGIPALINTLGDQNAPQ